MLRIIHHLFPTITESEILSTVKLLDSSIELQGEVVDISTLTTISNDLGYTYFCKATTIKELMLEMYRFRPNFIDPKMWYTIDDKDLSNVFHFMLTHSLATHKMFALFFKKIPLANIQNYFSKRNSQEILEEMSKLENVEDSLLLDSIYYIIERNLMTFLSFHSCNFLLEYQNLLSFYQEYFLSQNQIKLSDYPEMTALKNSPQFALFLNKHKGVASFLKHNDPSNFEFLKSGFSTQGWKTIMDDADNAKISDSFIKAIASQISSRYDFDDLAELHLTEGRHWEFLGRECDIRDVFLCLDKIRHKVDIGFLSHTYQAYKKGIVIFPNIKSRSIIQAQKSCSEGILYLKLIGLLD